MPKEDVIYDRTKLKYVGNFDFKDMYKRFRIWITQNQYSDPREIKYIEKITPAGKTVEFVWETSKFKEDYFELKIEIEFFIKGLKDAEADFKGRKIKLDNGEIEVAFTSRLIRNCNKKWDEHGLIFKLYEKYIIAEYIEQFKIDVYRDTNRFMEELKNYFNLFKLR